MKFFDSDLENAFPLEIPSVTCGGFEEEEGKEAPKACMMASSTKLVPDENKPTSGSVKNLPPLKPHPIENAFK